MAPQIRQGQYKGLLAVGVYQNPRGRTRQKKSTAATYLGYTILYYLLYYTIHCNDCNGETVTRKCQVIIRYIYMIYDIGISAL